MKQFLISRLLIAIPVIVSIVAISFLLLRLVPGDPVTALIGEYPAPPEYVEKIRQDFGLDRPMLMQFGLFVAHLFQGDLGFSFVNRQNVTTLLAERAARTLMLMIPGLVCSSLFGIGIALIGARKPGGRVDTFITTFSLVSYSTPIFWFGQLLIIVFAVTLQWLPAQGMFSLRGVGSGFMPTFIDFVLHWIMPGLAITLFYGGIVARVARASLREALGQDFMNTALAKGLTEREALRGHALPNAMVPIASVIGYNFGHALTGTIMVEAVFGWPGLGGLFLTSISSRDYPVLQGIFLLAAMTVVVANLVTDIVYGLIDPRIRQGSLGS